MSPLVGQFAAVFRAYYDIVCYSSSLPKALIGMLLHLEIIILNLPDVCISK